MPKWKTNYIVEWLFTVVFFIKSVLTIMFKNGFNKLCLIFCMKEDNPGPEYLKGDNWYMYYGMGYPFVIWLTVLVLTASCYNAVD